MSARIRGDGCRRNVEARVGPVRDDAREYFLGDARGELKSERVIFRSSGSGVGAELLDSSIERGIIPQSREIS